MFAQVVNYSLIFKCHRYCDICCNHFLLKAGYTSFVNVIVTNHVKLAQGKFAIGQGKNREF